jgi:hypothetical protein
VKTPLCVINLTIQVRSRAKGRRILKTTVDDRGDGCTKDEIVALVAQEMGKF